MDNQASKAVLCTQCPLKFTCESAQPHYAERNTCPLWVVVSRTPIQKYERIANMEKRQSAILNMIAQGYKSGEIADRLYLSLGTVKRDTSILCSQFEARNRAHLVTLAMQAGAVDLHVPEEAENGNN